MNEAAVNTITLEKGSVKEKVYLGIKRTFDICVSFIGILFLIPITILLKVAYLLSGDFHSMFYSQKRIGKDGKEFKFYKFRSMLVNSEEILSNTLKMDPIAREEYKKNKKLKNDPRITKVGKFIRKTSIDELPQLINIFKGEMSLIGNRPYLPREKEDMGPFYNSIIKTKPGLTGYCLPKDTKQLLANYKKVPQNLIEAIVKSNDTRKDHITRMILRKNPTVVGIYRLTMKTDSDNFRASAIQGIIDRLKFYNVKVVVYEPTLKADSFNECQVIRDFDTFARLSDVVLVNRLDENAKKISDKIYTRDLFARD